MQVTIYIPKDDEWQWEAMKQAAEDQKPKIGIGAYIIQLDTEKRLRADDGK